MSVKVIAGYDDAEFSIYENYFWAFHPDDWDYMIIGESKYEVETLAEKLKICDFQIKQFVDRWIAVTYHS